MVVAAAAAIFAAATALISPDVYRSKPKAALASGPNNLSTNGIKLKPNAGGIQVKTNAHAAPKINGSKVVFTTTDNGKAAGLMDEDEFPSYSSSSQQGKTIINQLPDWSVLLAAITAMVLAAEKQLINFDWKPKRPDMLMETFGFGRIVHDGFVFRQSFPIRSYEIGADRTASIETLMNHLQETSLNHVKRAGLLGDGFGSTPEMSRRGLIWVVTRMQIVVDRYPSWGDIVEVDTWVGSSGKNGMRRDWCVRDCNTGETVARATSVWVMMNKGTRKLSKMPDEVRGEIGPYFFETAPIIDEDGGKLPKLDDTTADGVRTGLMPRWYDLDVNQHVNNVKYINWILESAPISILESYELASMTLEYRRECVRNSIVQSLTSLSDKETPSSGLECTHLLRLEDGAELVRGRTQWRPKHKGPD
ncbi:Palmitoyl-acyl carrier protein thioesterase [Nymphaea thermarum]|nr:Palmitoyl-acyl carrier protein thioesterase [Nymphaea thermarum]